VVGFFAGSRQEIHMFTAEQRDHVRQRVLALAQSDPRVTAGALTGSMVFGGGDRWSDLDVAFGIAEGITPEAVLEDWTAVLAREWGVLDHFDRLCCKNSQRNTIARRFPVLVGLRLPLQRGRR